MPALSQAYRELERRFREISLLGDVSRVLHWDQAVMMPPGGGAARAEQLAAIDRVRHDKLTDPAMAELFDAAAGGLDDWQRANLREMRRKWSLARAVPADLVSAHSMASSQCEGVWRNARTENDFAMVAADLERVLDLTREIGEARAEASACSVYEALLAAYEPGGSTAQIDRLFDACAAFLPDLIDDVLARQARGAPAVPPPGPFPVDVQRGLARRIAETIGLDFDTARLDESAHPFSSGVPEDSRITVRYNEADFAEGLMAVLHEAGHAAYERNRPADWRLQPVGDARGMVIHESQSLLVEMQVCRSAEFYRYAAPLLRAAFGGEGDAWEPANLHRRSLTVARSFIRVDADEVTYPAHVIQRYRLEQAMLAGDLRVADLPGAWNDGLWQILGVAPPDDRQGCLQDIHWYSGAWGYFPTYTLGAMAAAQIYDAALKSEPSLPESIARGDFAPLMAWLGANIHGKGSLLSTGELLEAATGAPLQAGKFESHLRRRYLGTT